MSRRKKPQRRRPKTRRPPEPFAGLRTFFEQLNAQPTPEQRAEMDRRMFAILQDAWRSNPEFIAALFGDES